MKKIKKKLNNINNNIIKKMIKNKNILLYIKMEQYLSYYNNDYTNYYVYGGATEKMNT